MNRRHFLQTAAALPFATRALAMPDPKPATAPSHILLGTDTGKGIYRAPWNPATGMIGAIELHAPCDRPVYFAHHPTEPILYAANEMGDGKSLLSSYRIAGGGVLPLQQMPCDDGPCYVSVDRSNVYVANYSAGSFETWPLDPEGHIVPTPRAIRPKKFTHPGPVADRQDNPHFHCAVISPDGGHIVVCDLGSDRINIIEKPGKDLRVSAGIQNRPGSGPRHVAFHPNGRWMYCIHELDCTIQRFDWSGSQLSPAPDATLTLTLTPGTPLKGNTACELLISPDGRFAYATVRGTDELIRYDVDAKTGNLTEQQRMPIGGKTPRLIAFDPSRRWLVSCNQGAPGNITVFAHDPATGHIAPTPQVFAGPTPMCVAWL